MRKFLVIFFLFGLVTPAFSAGYVGTLPDIEAEFSYLKKVHSEKSSPVYSLEELDKKSEKDLKPIPRNDKNYVDIVIKEDKTTQYTNDLNSVILIIEKLRKCLNKYGNIQQFNAIVSNLIDNIYYIQEEYKDKPESTYLSYARLLALADKARDVANYRMKCRLTESYLPYSSPKNIYTDQNLDYVLQNFLNDVNDTLFVLKNMD